MFARKEMLVSYGAACAYLVLGLIAAGCAASGGGGGLMAGATASAPQTQAAPLAPNRPSRIVVFPFTTNNANVTLNQGFGARLYRNYSGEDSDLAQAKLAQDTAQSICVQVATKLASGGWNAVCEQRGTPVTADNALVIDGVFTDISEGNRLQRMVIGLGAGASIVDTSVVLFQFSGGNSTQLLTFTTHADSGKMPGAGITGPAGAAAGGAAAAASLGANVAASGVKNIRSSTAFLADQSAKQIVNQMNNYFSQQGWNPVAPSA